MTIVVFSPYDGQPVTIRTDQAGQRVQDAAGRTFYVVAKTDGSGFYGSLTKAGSRRDEQHARAWEQRRSSAATAGLAADERATAASAASEPPAAVQAAFCVAIIATAAWAVWAVARQAGLL